MLAEIICVQGIHDALCGIQAKTSWHSIPLRVYLAAHLQLLAQGYRVPLCHEVYHWSGPYLLQLVQLEQLSSAFALQASCTSPTQPESESASFNGLRVEQLVLRSQSLCLMRNTAEANAIMRRASIKVLRLEALCLLVCVCVSLCIMYTILFLHL